MAGKINNRIKVCRAERDMTQEELARRVGVTRQTIIAIEKNRYSPSLELAFRIARVFGKSVEDVFEYEGGGELR
jgi:putative transcriptional regulator